VRWSVGGVTFVGLNIPGSNNNFPTTLRSGATVGNLEEYTERNAANLAWMRESFALATQDGRLGLMLFIQGNPFPFSPNDSNLNGYEEFLAALEGETLKFAKPVVLAHGDSHYFHVDKPLPRPDPDGYLRSRIVNFTRVENFGSPGPLAARHRRPPRSGIVQFQARGLTLSAGGPALRGAALAPSKARLLGKSSVPSARYRSTCKLFTQN
jgi:hypothetical protein